jgi:hypothetical protein
MIDKNIQMSYLIVDEMHNEHPELLKDQYWDEIPNKLLDRNNEGGESDDSQDGLSDIVDFDVVKRSHNRFGRHSTYTVPIPKEGKTKDVEAGGSKRRVRKIDCDKAD